MNNLCEDYLETKINLIEKITKEIYGDDKVERKGPIISVWEDIIPKELWKNGPRLPILAIAVQSNYVASISHCIDSADRSQLATYLHQEYEDATQESWHLYISSGHCNIKPDN